MPAAGPVEEDTAAGETSTIGCEATMGASASRAGGRGAVTRGDTGGGGPALGGGGGGGGGGSAGAACSTAGTGVTVEASGAAASLAPQLPQKLAPTRVGDPHDWQVI